MLILDEIDCKKMAKKKQITNRCNLFFYNAISGSIDILPGQPSLQVTNAISSKESLFIPVIISGELNKYSKLTSPYIYG